jgi:hypothetical protein
VAYSRNADRVRENLLLNSDFRLWQRGTSQTIANGATAYQADRWYAKNSLGTNGVITYTRQSGTNTTYAAKLLITTAPTASQANGCELYQVLENQDSLQLYNQTASFHVQVKAFGNVNKIGVQFFYATTEVKLTNAIGNEQTYAVNTSSYTTATIDRQALGTSATTSGVVGVRIRIAGVSSGNTYDLNNGFQVEQAMLNRGAPSVWKRASSYFGDELARCQRFYEKSYALETAPGGAASSSYSYPAVFTDGTRTYHANVKFAVLKRGAPTVTAYSTTGAAGLTARVSGATEVISSSNMNVTAKDSMFDVGTNSGALSASFPNANGSAIAFWLDWTADAEI